MGHEGLSYEIPFDGVHLELILVGWTPILTNAYTSIVLFVTSSIIAS